MRLVVVAALILAAPSLTHAQFTQRSWSEARALAQAAVANMSTSEKAGVVQGQGQFGGRCVGNLHGVSRLGIPDICLQDGPAGIRATDGASGFPGGMNAAATFDRSLMQARGAAIGAEFRGKGAHIHLGPAIDIMRLPAAGRAWEGFGSDAFLTGEAAFQTITGIQSAGVQAVAKHLTGYAQEHYRFTMSSNMDDKTLHELYIAPYLRAIDADVSGMMCAYNRLNDTYACSNPDLMGPSGILRSQAAFQGYFVSDWLATHDDANTTAMAGLDLEMPGGWLIIGGGSFDDIASDAQSSPALLQRLNAMCVNILTPYFRLGQDQGFPPTNFNVQTLAPASENQHVVVRTAAHTALIRQIASASAVLIKNANAALPLAVPASIAIIGTDADYPETGCDLNACQGGTLTIGWGSGTTTLDNVVPPVAALLQRVAAQGNVTQVAQSLSNDVNAALAAARGKAVALVFCNSDSGEIGTGLTEVDGNFGDKNNLDLWRQCGSLVQAVAAVNSNTMVIIHTTGPVLTGPWGTSPNVTAMIVAGLPGEQTGPALMDVLYGDVNPSARLPYTMASAMSDYPAGVLYFAGLDLSPDITFSEGVFNDYKHFDQANIAPAFPFGFGLSYTTFAYAGLSISVASAARAVPFERRAVPPSTTPLYTVSFNVTNTGARAGTEIAQLYLGFPAGAGEPPKLLKGFEAVPLNASQTQMVTIPLSLRELSVWDVPSQSWSRPAGTFTVYVGASSRDIRLSGSI